VMVTMTVVMMKATVILNASGCCSGSLKTCTLQQLCLPQTGWCEWPSVACLLPRRRTMGGEPKVQRA
jgi:hypothetical protein